MEVSGIVEEVNEMPILIQDNREELKEDAGVKLLRVPRMTNIDYDPIVFDEHVEQLYPSRSVI